MISSCVLSSMQCPPLLWLHVPKLRGGLYIRIFFPFSFQTAYFILVSFVSGTKKLGAEACRLLVFSWHWIPHTSQWAIGLLPCVRWKRHCRSIRKGKPEIGPFNLINGRYKGAGLPLLLVKTAALSKIQTHQLSSAQLYRFGWTRSFS